MSYPINHSAISEKAHALINTRFPSILPIINALYVLSGKVFLVGGAVRDIILERPVEELDMEIHHISLHNLYEVLSRYGDVNEVGKSYGVLRLQNLNVDWSLPRIDSNGRKPDVTIIPDLPLAQALMRRDLTINSIALELAPSEFSIHDPHKGMDDIRHSVLRATNETSFVEDPLRFFRVMRYTATLEMFPDRSLSDICSTMSLENIAQERITNEFKKMFLQSKVPSLGFRWLSKINRLFELFEPLEKTVPCECALTIDTIEHLFQSIDAYSLQLHISKNTFELIHVFTLVTHCFNNNNLSKIFLKRMMGSEVNQYKSVQRLSSCMKQSLSVMHYKNNPQEYKRLAMALAQHNQSISSFAQLIKADIKAKNAIHTPYDKNSLEIYKNIFQSDDNKFIHNFIDSAEKNGVLYEPEPAVINGKDLLSVIPQSPLLGEILKKTYEYQITTGCRCYEKLYTYAMNEYIKNNTF